MKRDKHSECFFGATIMVSLQITLIRFIKALAIVIFSIIFIITASDTWTKYQIGMTTTGIRYRREADGKGVVPDISLCPMPGFKYGHIFFNTYLKKKVFIQKCNVLSSSDQKGIISPNQISKSRRLT